MLISEKGNRPVLAFIGNFLSLKTGTKGVSEKLTDKLRGRYKIVVASSYTNKLLRLLHFVGVSLFFNYDVIHIDVFSGQAFTFANITSLIGRLRNKKVILTLRGGNLPAFFRQKPDLTKRVLNRADVVQTPSMMIIESVRHVTDRISYMPNFIGLDYFPYHRENIKLFSLLWVRAFGTIYNPILAINVLALVKKQFPEATLTMIGPDKGLLTDCLKEIDRLGLQKSVTITGPVKNEILASFYQNHHVYLNTPSFESFGVAVVEAASCGIPIVSFAVGELPYLWVHEEDIMLVEGMDVAKMAYAVSQLFENPEKAQRISLRARKKAESFSWLTVEQKWIALFDTI